MFRLSQFSCRRWNLTSSQGGCDGLHLCEHIMNKRRPYFRNALDMTSKVQVKVLRRRLKLSNGELAAIVRKSGNSISTISKEAAKT